MYARTYAQTHIVFLAPGKVYTKSLMPLCMILSLTTPLCKNENRDRSLILECFRHSMIRFWRGTCWSLWLNDFHSKWRSNWTQSHLEESLLLTTKKILWQGQHIFVDRNQYTYAHSHEYTFTPTHEWKQKDQEISGGERESTVEWARIEERIWTQIWLEFLAQNYFLPRDRIGWIGAKMMEDAQTDRGIHII